MKILIEFIKDDPKEFAESVIGWGCLFAMVFLMAGIGV